MAGKKSAIVTFKADPALYEVLQRLPNRSEFIRAAILTALENTCPLCGGTGVLTVSQQQHWASLLSGHTIERCSDCREPYLVCQHEQTASTHEVHGD